MPGYMNNATAGGGTTTNAYGSGQDPGLMGNNTYQVSQYNIDQGAFTNPAGTGAPEYNQGAQAELNNINNTMKAPQLGAAATSNGPGNTGQLGVANQFMNIANGTGPSLADVTAARQTQQAQAANLQAMGSARGVANPALANYLLGQQNAGIQQQNAATAVSGKTAEQLAALGAAGQAFSGVTQNQQFNATQIQSQAQAQAQLEAQQRGLTAQEYNNYVQTRAAQLANTMQAQQAGQSLQVQNNLGTQQLQESAFNSAANHALGSQLLGAATAIGGSFAGPLVKASDQRLKKHIKPAKQALEKFLSNYKGNNSGLAK